MKKFDFEEEKKCQSLRDTDFLHNLYKNTISV